MRSGFQTKRGAAVETVINTLVGWVLAYSTYLWVVTPLFDLDITWVDNIGVSLLMTVQSLARQYTIRRFFTKG